MAKGDDSRARNRLDEQQKLAQGYLSGVQQNLANQGGAYNNLYWGGSDPQVGGTFGHGSTVPNFSWYNQSPFTGNGTDTPTPISGSYGSGGQSGQDPQAYFNSLFPGDSLSSDQLWAQKDALAAQGIQVMTNHAGTHGKIKLPNGQIVDVIQGAGAGHNVKAWQTGGGGSSFAGGIPGQTMKDYGNIMGNYGDLLGDYKDFFGDARGQWGGFLGSASNMANTGGLSEGDKANLRSRAISPIRAVYANSLRNVDRQRSLQGGYSPGYTTAMGRFNREMGQGVSDATTNAEAAIAEMVQKGKLGGLSAWGSGLSGMTSGLGGLLGGMGNTVGGMAGLYSATPGMATTFGNQALAANAQNLDASKIQAQLGLGLINQQTEAGKLPGKFQSAMGNVGSALQVGGSIAGMAYPWFGNKMPDFGMGTTVSPGTSYGYAGGTGIDPNSMFAGY